MMENVKLMFREIVAQRLSGAPESTAKGELIEELAENLCCRYEDMINSGVEEQEAKDRTVDALGDTAELVEYLKGLEPDQPLPEMVLDSEKEDGSQIEEILLNVEDILRGVFQKTQREFRKAKEVWKEAKEQNEDWKVTYQKGEWNVEITSEQVKTTIKDAVRDIEQAVRDAAESAKEICKNAAETMESVCDVDAPLIDVDVKAASSDRLIGIDVKTAGGDITVRMTQEPDGDVLVGGDIDKLEVTRSESGVLTIRPIKTETSGFFLGRGIFNSGSAADVTLDLPRREWEFLQLAATGGDVELSGDCPVEGVFVTTVSGDIEAALPSCTHVECSSTGGDIRWEGNTAALHMESVSGDLHYCGHAQGVTYKTTSGDITAEGGFLTATARTISGDVHLRSNELPARIDVGTTSGDMWVDVPDAGPFTARFRSTSGDFTSDFFKGRMGGRSCVFNYQGGGENEYSFASVSGDVEIRKYR